MQSNRFLGSIYILFGMIAGMMLPLQGAINSNLNNYLETPFQAGLISFTGATVTMTIIVALVSKTLPKRRELKRIPWHLYIGGMLGTFLVASFIVVTPYLGVALTMGSAIAGQVTLALLIDHFGWFGTPVVRVSAQRLLGVALLILGVFLCKV